MEYFSQFPNLFYTFDKNQQEFFTLKNIFARVNVIGSVLQNSEVYYKYSVQEQDTLESIAFKYYGDPKRHWMIILANMIIDPYFDMPLKQDDFQNNIILKYGSAANALHQIAVYQQTLTVESISEGLSNTQTYVSTVTPEPYTYDFRRKELLPTVLPTLGNPIITTNQSDVIVPDGTRVITTTTLEAIDAYTNETNINEAKRLIVLIDATYASQVENEFQNLLATG